MVRKLFRRDSRTARDEIFGKNHFSKAVGPAALEFLPIGIK